MNYSVIYEQLIAKGVLRSTTKDGVWETHHIVPKCMGGSNSKDNLVKLTPEEHYLAHQLLIKIYPDCGSLIHAAIMMGVGRSSNKIYGWLKRKHIELMKTKTGIRNNRYGTRWIHNKDLKENRVILKTDIIPEGWTVGRVMNFDKSDDKPKRSVKQANIESAYKRNQVTEGRAHRLFNSYLTSGCKSINEFSKTDLCNVSQPALSMLWKKYIPEYKEYIKPKFSGVFKK